MAAHSETVEMLHLPPRGPSRAPRLEPLRWCVTIWGDAAKRDTSEDRPQPRPGGGVGEAGRVGCKGQGSLIAELVDICRHFLDLQRHHHRHGSLPTSSIYMKSTPFSQCCIRVPKLASADTEVSESGIRDQNIQSSPGKMVSPLTEAAGGGRKGVDLGD
jgi:hypothetical protein